MNGITESLAEGGLTSIGNTKRARKNPLESWNTGLKNISLKQADYYLLSFQGMIKAALFIKKKLDSGILTKAFHSDPVGSLLY